MGRLLTAVLAALPESIRTYAAGGFAGVLLCMMLVVLVATANRVVSLPQTAVNFAVLCVVIAATVFVVIVISLIAFRLLQLAYRSWREGS